MAPGDLGVTLRALYDGVAGVHAHDGHLGSFLCVSEIGL
jgi:hypothetical protein